MSTLIIRILITLICFLLGVISFLVWDSYQSIGYVNLQEPESSSRTPWEAYQSGKAQAEADLSRGTLKVKTYEMARDWPDLYKERLWSDYRIELERVAGGAVSRVLAEEIRGYDEVSMAEIDRRFGRGIFAKAYQQSVHEWKRRHVFR